MEEHAVNLTDPVAETAASRSYTNLALYTAVAVVGVIVVAKGVQKFAAAKDVVVTVADATDA